MTEGYNENLQILSVCLSVHPSVTHVSLLTSGISKYGHIWALSGIRTGQVNRLVWLHFRRADGCFSFDQLAHVPDLPMLRRCSRSLQRRGHTWGLVVAQCSCSDPTTHARCTGKVSRMPWCSSAPTRLWKASTKHH